MPITVTEKFESRSGDRRRQELVFNILGTDDDSAARSAMLASDQCPLTHDGLPRDDRSAHVEPVGNGQWLGRVTYTKSSGGGSTTPLDPGQNSVTFRTTGGSQHITQSIQTVSRYPASAPDFKGAINVGFNASGDAVEGVDIGVPVFAFQVRRAIEVDALTPSYLADLFYLTATFNGDTWGFTTSGSGGATFSFAAGEILFRGVSDLTIRDDDVAELTLEFEGSPNRSNFDVGGITVGFKRGWDYLWVRYEPEVVSSQGQGVPPRLLTRPVAVYVEQVMFEGDFSYLGM